MKGVCLISLLLIFGCVPDEGPKGQCVVYNGYNQIWVTDLKQMTDRTLVATKDGKRIVIRNYSTYECY